MKTLKSYEKPEIHIELPFFNLMLELPVSNGTVDDEATKERFDDGLWPDDQDKNPYSLW